MTAFGFVIFLTAAMTGVIYLWARRRPPGSPLSWGEAFLGGAFVLAYLLVLYGALPDVWLRWCDGPLKWRSDKLGIPAGVLGNFKLFGAHIHLLSNGRKYLGFIPYDKGALWPHGITFFGRGKVAMNAQALRDIVATGIYGGALVLNVKGWLWWQRRGKTATATPELATSAYGRPLVKRA
ncbi:MAG: hypothetical protein ACYDH6_02100 [Acidimicrobiales bacterium]